MTSVADGTVYRFNLKTGQRQVLTPATGVESIGILLDDHGRLFVAGGYAGNMRVIDSHSGKVLVTYQLAKDSHTAVNDFTILDGNLYVTDSLAPVLYKVPLGKEGQLPEQSQIKTIPFDGITFAGEGDQGWNASGITPTPDGKALLVVQTNTGILYRVDQHTGKGTPVDVGGADLSWGDGMRLEGRTLYVVRNTPNKLTVLHLNKSGTKGRFGSHGEGPWPCGALGSRQQTPGALTERNETSEALSRRTAQDRRPAFQGPSRGRAVAGPCGRGPPPRAAAGALATSGTPRNCPSAVSTSAQPRLARRHQRRTGKS
ncbi:superoxide dismutase [Streptomyces mirabilis]|uniref:superoxide dismutase n=1 Tax=Streptomyces mirabilis TaxID=68239 RepID=UPI0036CBA50C